MIYTINYFRLLGSDTICTPFVRNTGNIMTRYYITSVINNEKFYILHTSECRLANAQWNFLTEATDLPSALVLARTHYRHVRACTRCCITRAPSPRGISRDCQPVRHSPAVENTGGPGSYFYLCVDRTGVILHRAGCAKFSKETEWKFLGTMYSTEQALAVARKRSAETIRCPDCCT